MFIKLSRVLGIVGGAMSLLLGLVLTVASAMDFTKPNNVAFYKSLYFFYFAIGFAVCVLSVISFTGSCIIHKKPVISGVLMIVSGGILLFFFLPLTFYMRLRPVFLCVICISPVLITAAGILALFRKRLFASHKVF